MKTRASELVERIGRDEVTIEEKERLREELCALGGDAIPVLIEHLGDRRPFERGRDVQNYIGLPPDGSRPQPLLVDVTVGQECESMLLRILTPAYRSPHEPREVRKPRGGGYFRVTDWGAWSRVNRDKPLAEIHREMQAVIDRYWQQDETTQTLP